jgi:hypothetical protein
MIIEAAQCVSRNDIVKKYQFCLVVSPAPNLLSESIKAHGDGCTFTKRFLVDKIKKKFIVDDNLSAAICVTPNPEVFERCMKESEVLVYFGIGVGFENEVKCQDLLTPNMKILPAVVII